MAIRNSSSTTITVAASSLAVLIAEGVETDDQLAWLEGTGCDGVQGYRITRSLPPDQVLINVA